MTSTIRSAEFLSRTPGTVEMTIDDHTVVVDRNGEQMVTLNAVGGLIWELLATATPIETLINACSAAYPDVDQVAIAADVSSFVDAAIGIGVIEASGS
ncbi:MAG: hypothetical protein ACI8TP_000762 [Acidimicrobiales bacterium]|jgi:hypothetical protein